MPDETNAQARIERPLDDVLALYIAGEEAGRAPDRQELLARYPQLAGELREFFANRDQMQRLAEPLRGGAEVSQTGRHPLGKVRYIGDYELLEDVAAGGMGIIYKARQLSLNRIVAVKMILRGTLAREDDVKRFRAEAEAAANLQHPAIVAIHEVGLHEGQHYFSMDFVDGHSLAELPRERPLSAHQAAEYIRDAAEAVYYAHQQGTLHRDLKPSNILIDRQGRVRITDFGLAKRIEGNGDLTLTGQILGTPSYMPPEQATSKRSLVGVASDIYSLGAVLYELLTGRPPFRGESPAETLRQVESMEPVSPRLLNPATPCDLETICLKCLEKEPHRRYGTAQLLADDLGRYLRGESIVARPISRPARAWRWCKRNPALVMLSTAIVVLLSISTIASTVGYISTKWALKSEVQRRQAEDNLQAKEAMELMLGSRPDFALAEEQFSVILARRPDDPLAHLHRAQARWERGLVHKAIDDARRSTELRPKDNSAAWLLVVEGALELGDISRAQEAGQHLERNSSGSSEALAARALLDAVEPDSLGLMSQAIEREPFDPRYLSIRGWVAYQLMLRRTSKRHYQQSVADLERVLQSRPFDWRARQRLCACYVLFYFLADEGAKPLDRAKALIDAWLAQSPEDLVGLALLSRWHLAQEQWDDALGVCQRGRNLDVSDLELAGLEAEILLHQEQYRQADEVLELAERLVEKRHSPLPVSRVRIAGQRAQCALALTSPEAVESNLADYQTSAESSHWTYFDWESLTTALRLLGNKQQAVRGILVPRFAPSATVSGHVRCQALCQRWQAFAPDCSGPLEAQVTLSNASNDSIEELTAALKLSPSLRWARFHRGRMYAKMQNSDRQAISDFEAFLGYLPDQPLALWELAQLRLNTRDIKLRDPAQASDLARRIVARDPQRHDAWHLIAQAQQRLGRYSESLTAIEMALTVQPRNSTYHMLRGDLLMDSGRTVESRASYDRALQTGSPPSKHLDAIAFRLSLSGHGIRECYEHALALAEEARSAFERKAIESFKPLSTGVALYRLGRWQEALAALDAAIETRSLSDPFGGRYDLHDLALVRVMTLWQLGRRNEAWTQYQEVARSLGAKNVMTEPMKRHVAELRRETARLIGSQLGPEPILQDVATRQVGPGDYPQWGGWAGRNNVGQGDQSPIDWDPGTFDRKTGAWHREKSRNIKWVSNLGSQTYGNPAVANGRIFIGTNNSHGYLKRYPADVDLGVLLCFRESDGEFLWQHSCEKLPTGRVHDWPLQGICSSPLVEGDRLWVVTNRGEVVCLDIEGFRDGEDDGPVQGLREPLFRVLNNLHSGLDNGDLPSQIRAALVNASVKLPGQWHVGVVSPGERWSVNEYISGQASRRHLQIDLVNEELQVRPSDGSRPFPQPALVTISDRLWDGLGTPQIIESLRPEFAIAGLELPQILEVQAIPPGKAWKFNVVRDDGRIEVVVRQGARHIDAVRTDFTSSKDKQQSDVVWSLDMMKELGVSQHNMASCAPTAWKDTLFVCTSNGVDEQHTNIPAPEAPSFIALEKHTGKVLWTDNSPGKNIQHGQWSAPAVGVFAGVPQVIFGGGDGWVYSFHAEEWKDGHPILLWKFDINPKDTILELGGRGTRNEPFAVPVVYDGLVYVTTGQDPEHGEGAGYLWCIDPTRRGDVSAQLAVTISDRNTVLPHKRRRAIEPENGEMAIDNPNSAVVWSYGRVDANNFRRYGFTDQFHRSISSVVIKNDILIACDFSGLVHCLNAKTGQRYWTCDLLAAVWSTPLIVGDRAYVPDEDGDIAIFRIHPDPERSTQHLENPDEDSREPLYEINMGNSVYSTPVFANGMLYIAMRDHLFAIANVDNAAKNANSEKNQFAPR